MDGFILLRKRFIMKKLITIVLIVGIASLANAGSIDFTGQWRWHHPKIGPLTFVIHGFNYQDGSEFDQNGNVVKFKELYSNWDGFFLQNGRSVSLKGHITLRDDNLTMYYWNRDGSSTVFIKGKWTFGTNESNHGYIHITNDTWENKKGVFFVSVLSGQRYFE